MYKFLSSIITLCFLLLNAQVLKAQDLWQSYQLALENNPKLKESYYEKLAISESKAQSIAQMLPTMSFLAHSSSDYIESRKITFQGSGRQNYYKHLITLELRQPVFYWQHWVELDQSENKIAKAQANYLAKEQDLMLDVTEAYFNVLAAKDKLISMEAEKKATEAQYEKSKALFEEGWTAETAVFEAKAALDKTKAQLIKTQNTIENSLSKLIELTGGVEEIELQSLAKKIEFSSPKPNDLSAWLTTAKNNNLSIVAALNEVEVQRKAVEIQQAGHYPTLDIVGSYDFSDDNSSFGLRGEERSIGLQLKIPLFEGGAVYSKTKQAEFEFQAAKQRLQQTQREVSTQVKTGYREVLANLAQIEALKSMLTSTEAAYQAVTTGFEVGTRSMVDMLNAQRDFYQTQRDYNQSLYDYLLSSIRLKQTSSSLTPEDLQKINALLQP